jgi:hypothetical protein
MMKKIILAVSLMFGGAVFVNAQDQQQDTTQTQTQQSDQYRSDSTSTDDTQNQNATQSDTNSTQQSDMYRTETDSTSTGDDASSTGTQNETDASSTGTQTPTTPPITDDQSSTGSTSQSGVSQDDQDQEGEKIEVSELPAAVQTKLQSTDYQGWVVSSARKKMWTDPSDPQATSKEVYVIEAKNGSDTKKLKFDKDGNEIEHDKNKKDDQK